jgi:hypothetical protein
MTTSDAAAAKPERNHPDPYKVAANFALFLCVLAWAVVYAHWLMSWIALGHMPRPSLDDPKFIDGASWMHPISFLALVAVLPTALVALLANAWYLAATRPRGFDLVWRFAVIAAVVGLFLCDPLRVGEWLVD